MATRRTSSGHPADTIGQSGHGMSTVEFGIRGVTDRMSAEKNAEWADSGRWGKSQPESMARRRRRTQGRGSTAAGGMAEGPRGSRTEGRRGRRRDRVGSIGAGGDERARARSSDGAASGGTSAGSTGGTSSTGTTGAAGTTGTGTTGTTGTAATTSAAVHTGADIDLGGDNHIVLLGVTSAQLNANDFVFV